MDNLTSGLQDYIEAIYIAKNGLRGADLSRSLNVSRASVSEALSKLVNKGLVEYKSYGIIVLTEEGKRAAKKVYNAHNILKTFFESVLGIESNEASENACRIEHIISDNLLEQISQFTEFCERNTDILERYKTK